MTVEQQVNAANERVLEILIKARPVWTDVKPALQAIPGMTKTTILVPGPPLPVEKLTMADPHLCMWRGRT